MFSGAKYLAHFVRYEKNIALLAAPKHRGFPAVKNTGY